MMNSRSIVNNMMAAAALTWVYFLEITWLKFPNKLTWLKVGYDIEFLALSSFLNKIPTWFLSLSHQMATQQFF